MRHGTLLLAAALSSFTGACASTPEPWAPTSQPSFSSPSSPVSSYSVQPSAPNQIVVDADLIVRPDKACLPLAIVTHAIDVDVAIAAAKAAVADVITRSGGTVRIDDLRTDTVPGDPDEPTSTLHYRVTISAVLEHDLADDDVFARSAVVAHLVESLRPLLPPQHTLQRTDTPAPKGPPAVTYAVGRVEPGIKDIEQYRQRLLDGWAARVTAMSKSVGGDEVDLQSCQAPPAVQVRGGTFEKFGVSLPISCSITIKARS
jgi:hypothetical protein